ncbi:hypothetical protein MYOV003v1_p0053 [Vibrio phage 207E48.1]|nr:hypothetical protein MYOV003v1_p0053 [Vibrio phage 207E48.1]
MYEDATPEADFRSIGLVSNGSQKFGSPVMNCRSITMVGDPVTVEWSAT